MKASGLDILNPRFGDSSASVSGGDNNSKTKAAEVKEIVMMTNPDVKRLISVAEYKKLSSPSLPPSQRRALFVVKGEVYDGTDFLSEHPGGADSIWLVVGDLDAAEDFLAIHSDDSKKKLAKVSSIRVPG